MCINFVYLNILHISYIHVNIFIIEISWIIVSSFSCKSIITTYHLFMDIQTVKQWFGQMSATQVAKRTIRNIVKYSVLCLILWIGINRGMAIWQWHSFSAHRWVRPLIIVVFLIAFPLIYIWEIKTLATVDTVKYLWGNYRDDVVGAILDTWISAGKKTSQSILSSNSVQFFSSIRSQFPGILKRIIDYFLQKFPLLQKIPEAFTGVDLSSPDIWAIKQSILQKLQPYLWDTTEKPSFGHGVRMVVARNIVWRWVLYALLHYFF